VRGPVAPLGNQCRVTPAAALMVTGPAPSRLAILITEPCPDTVCEWWLKNEMFCNCTWVACNYGPFTLEEVGEMMGVTRERIRQIEAKALRKLQHKKRRDQLKDFASPDYDKDYR